MANLTRYSGRGDSRDESRKVPDVIKLMLDLSILGFVGVSHRLIILSHRKKSWLGDLSVSPASNAQKIWRLLALYLVAFGVTGMSAGPATAQQPKPDTLALLKFMPEGGTAAFFIRPAAIFKGQLAQAAFTPEQIENVASWFSVVTNYSGTEIEMIAAQTSVPNVLSGKTLIEKPAPLYIAVRGVPGTDSLRMQLALHEYQFQRATIGQTFQGTSYNLGNQFIAEEFWGFLSPPRQVNGDWVGGLLGLKGLNLKGAFRPDPRSVVLTPNATTTEAALKRGQAGPSTLALDLSRVPADCQFALVVLADKDDEVRKVLVYGSLTERPFLQARIDCTNVAAANRLASELNSQKANALRKAQADGTELDDFFTNATVVDWLQNTKVGTADSVVTVRARPALPALIQITQQAKNLVAGIPEVQFTPLVKRLTVELDLMQPAAVDAKKHKASVRGRTNLPAGASLQVTAFPDLLYQGPALPFLTQAGQLRTKTPVQADGTFVATLESHQALKTGDYRITIESGGLDHYCGPLVNRTPGGWSTPPEVTVRVTKKFELRTGEKQAVHRKEKRFYREAVLRVSRGLAALSRIAAADPNQRNLLINQWHLSLRQLGGTCERFEGQEAVSRFRVVLKNLHEMQWNLQLQKPAEFQNARQAFDTEFESLQQFIKGQP